MAVADHTVLGSGQDENSRIAGRVERYRLEHAKGSQSYGHRGALMPILSALIAGYSWEEYKYKYKDKDNTKTKIRSLRCDNPNLECAGCRIYLGWKSRWRKSQIGE